MKKVTIYFKSGNKITFVCSDIEIVAKDNCIKYNMPTGGCLTFDRLITNGEEIEAIVVHRPIIRALLSWIKAI